MNSILDEIYKLRKNEPLIIDYSNTNRYRVVSNETDGSKTAYYFTSPIYNISTRKAVDLKFHSKGSNAYAIGSNANITVSENIRIENSEGCALIYFNSKISSISEHQILYNNKKIYPTINGIVIESTCVDNNSFSFSIEISKPYLDIRANDRYFALMSERFRPFIVISCIGASDQNGNIISPAKLVYQKNTDRKYTITVTPCSSIAKVVSIEANIYEPKLFQDTTVESYNPKTNNAFGAIGFIGTTKEYGEQWFYSRPDFHKLSDMNDKRILRAVLHLPKLNKNAIELTASKVSARFCSFGSTWDNKISELSVITDSLVSDHYIDLDLRSLLSDKQKRFLISEGFILKSKKKGSGFSVITTADSYLSPQILEINYR